MLNLLGIAVIAWFAVRSSSAPQAVPPGFPQVLEARKNEPGLPAGGLDPAAVAPGGRPEGRRNAETAKASSPEHVAAADKAQSEEKTNGPKPSPPVPVAPPNPALLEPRILTTQEIVAKSEGSVVLIKGRHGSGTGFVVGRGLVATNAHVIEDESIPDLRIHFPSAPEADRGPLGVRRVRYKEPHRDLALLEVETQLPLLVLSRSYVLKRGEDVTIIGSPGLANGDVLKNAVSKGIMSTEVVVDGQRFYQLDVAANPGNSGGPAFNSRGEVIGIVTALARGTQSITICVPVEDLLEALEKTRDVLGSDLDE